MSIKKPDATKQQCEHTLGDVDEETGEERGEDDDHRDEDKHTHPEVTLQQMQTTSQCLLGPRKEDTNSKSC